MRLDENGLQAATRTFDTGLYAQHDEAYKRMAAATAVRAYIDISIARCRCGFTGTCVTEDARCATCGLLVDDESLRWLVKNALANFKRTRTKQEAER